jgi:hypothetical protein
MPSSSGSTDVDRCLRNAVKHLRNYGAIIQQILLSRMFLSQNSEYINFVRSSFLNNCDFRTINARRSRRTLKDFAESTYNDTIGLQTERVWEEQVTDQRSTWP